MNGVWCLPNTKGMSVEERFASLFSAYKNESNRISMETLICRNARLVFDGDGSIVVTTPRFDARAVKVLKNLGARGKKLGTNTSTQFEWTIKLSQLEEYCAYLPKFLGVIDGFLNGVARTEHNGAYARGDLYKADQAPGDGEIFGRCGEIYVCIRSERVTLGEGNAMVIKRLATADEAACYQRTKMSDDALSESMSPTAA